MTPHPLVAVVLAETSWTDHGPHEGHSLCEDEYARSVRQAVAVLRHLASTTPDAWFDALGPRDLTRLADEIEGAHAEQDEAILDQQIEAVRAKVEAGLNDGLLDLEASDALSALLRIRESTRTAKAGR